MSQQRLRSLVVWSFTTTLLLVAVGSLFLGAIETGPEALEILNGTLGTSALVLAAFSATACLIVLTAYARLLRDQARLDAGLPIAGLAEAGARGPEASLALPAASAPGSSAPGTRRARRTSGGSAAGRETNA